jgi:hypothetical protein
MVRLLIAGGVVNVPAGIENAAPPVLPAVPKERLVVDEVLIVPVVLEIGVFEVLKVRVFEPMLNAPNVRFSVPVRVTDEVSETPDELFIVKLLTVDGNPSPVT